MNIQVDSRGDSKVAIIESEEVLVRDLQDALDLMATVAYEKDGCNKLLIDKSLIIETFFDLKTKLAGDILQKFTNYRVKLAIIGDFSGYSSSSLKDFIYESNHGKQVFFLPTVEAGLHALHGVN
ncbi:MAG: hypothetical protein K0Q63_754 [Paenibacillus sp.]|jgi:hypothetical protein|nr:hypothetical protein [Paenibacillus sp.]